MAYRFESRIRYSEVGEDKKLTLPGLINYFQDCSTFQSEELGGGLDVLRARGRAWVLAYWQITVNRLPELGESVVTETWPYDFRGFFGERNFRMKDRKGETLACAASIWIYLDVNTGHPCRVDDDIFALYEPLMEERLPMEKCMRKLPVPEESVEEEPFPVMKSHLDTNHHVNNGQYISMAQEYLPKDFAVERIRVEYKKQAVLHDEVFPLVHREEGLCTVSLCDRERKPYAVVELKEMRKSAL